MPLIQQRVGRVREKVVKIHQEQGTLQAMLAVMVPQVLGQASVMEMQAAAFLAGFVIILGTYSGTSTFLVRTL